MSEHDRFDPSQHNIEDGHKIDFDNVKSLDKTSKEIFLTIASFRETLRAGMS